MGDELTIGQVWEDTPETEKLGFLETLKKTFGLKREPEDPEDDPQDEAFSEEMKADYDRLKASESILATSGELAWGSWVDSQIAGLIKKGNIPPVVQDKVKEVFGQLRGDEKSLSGTVLETLKVKGMGLEKYGETYTQVVSEKTKSFVELLSMLKAGVSTEDIVNEENPEENPTGTNLTQSEKLHNETMKRIRERKLDFYSDYLTVAKEVKEELEIKDI